jgi:hypothetical protein
VRNSLLRRPCACGHHTVSGGDCEAWSRKRQTGEHAAHSHEKEVPGIVHEVLSSGGRPLDPETRQFFEPRLGRVVGARGTTPHARVPQKFEIARPGDFHEQEADRIAEELLRTNRAGTASPALPQRERNPGYDLSQVRVHTEPKAARSAQAVDARAFTVGQHVVFGDGFYSPHSASGMKLLAHELAHTAQQAGDFLRRAPGPAPKAPKASSTGPCEKPDVCATVTTPSKLIEVASAESKTRREDREKKCSQVPEDPGCRAAGHAGRAVETEKMLGAYDAQRLKSTHGIFVDKDLEKAFGAYTTNCHSFTPPLAASGTCIAVPEKMEDNSKIFNSTTGPLTIDGMERGLWRERTIEVLSHEVGHVEFRKTFLKGFSDKFSTAIPNIMGKGRPTCKRDDTSREDVFSSVNELTAMLQEHPVRKEYVSITVRLPTPQQKEAELDQWRDRRIQPKRQSITNSLRVIRCLCGCQDADDLIRQTIEFATASWTLTEKNAIHQEMTDARWSALDLRWPFSPQPTAPAVLSPKP